MQYQDISAQSVVSNINSFTCQISNLRVLKQPITRIIHVTIVTGDFMILIVLNT